MWLSPVQVKILPISDSQLEYCQKVQKELMDKDIRVEIDERNEKIGYKIREAQIEKVPYMLVIGEKEVQSNTVGVRSRKLGDIGQMSINEFEYKVVNEVKNFERD